MKRIAVASIADNTGGASRAAYRLHRALLAAGMESRMSVHVKTTDDWTVDGPESTAGKALNLLRSRFGGGVARLQKTPNLNMHSANLLPSRWAARIDSAGADVASLHWVGGEMMSIADIGRIRTPLVWTLHDMWAFCGAEHVAGDGPEARWRHGYLRGNRPPGAGGIDIDRLTWNRKRRAWTRPVQLVTPSHWLAACVRDSALLHGWPVTVIPNVLDTAVFKPLERGFCRAALNLPQDARIVMFGAQGGARDTNKGYDLLVEALAILARGHAGILCAVFGQGEPRDAPPMPFAQRWMGRIGDDATLALLYGAADVFVIPSRLENLPQAGTEAHACGCPVVAFDRAGLPDVVQHQVTGYLARPYQPADLARGIAWVLADHERAAHMKAAARRRAEALWSPQAVVPAYLDACRAAVEAARAAPGQVRAAPQWRAGP